jgi:cytochrome P450
VGRDVSPDDILKNMLSLIDYLAKLIDSKIENPAEDALSDLAERVKAGEVDRYDAAMQGVGLLSAGHETTANMIALGTLALLQNPQQLAVIRDAEDPQIVANAVEELLRYLSIIHNGQRRVAVEDIEIGGETIRAGEGIIIDLVGANWDTDQFSEPEMLYLTRSNASTNVAFGYGRHQCVGQQLARAELQIVLPTLFRRVPTLRLATAIDDISFKNNHLAYGVHELPVEW